MDKQYDVIVIGGGPAGLAAALSAYENGAAKVLLLERNTDLGGILNQCIHNGFGLHYFKEELTGPEYAEKFINQISNTSIEVQKETMVLDVTPDKKVYAMNKKYGYMELSAQAIILCMGCRERTRGAIGIPGTRPAGVFTAGAAQLYMNIEGFQVGEKVIILGSGDIGLIMARRATLEGAKVLGVFEVMPYSGGLTRNIVQCLDDFDIPLHLSHTITEIKGDKRVESVVVQQVDEKRIPISGTEKEIECDTVLLSVGLIPENELSRQVGVKIDTRTNGPIVYENMETSIPGIFACGNVAHVHDLVDFVTAESQRAGKAAAEYCVNEKQENENTITINNGLGIGYTVPQNLRLKTIEKSADIFFRVNKVAKDIQIVVQENGNKIANFKREHVAPGEMEKITLPKLLLNKINSNNIEIKLEERA